MKDIVYELHNLCKHNADGSFDTRAKRERELKAMGLLLTKKLGFRRMYAHSLKPKHIDALVNYWKAQKLSPGTIKTRMSYLRWWAEKVGKKDIVARSNDAYGIDRRSYVSKISKAQVLDEQKIGSIHDDYVRMSVRLCAAFGLRKEEAIKFIPAYAIRGDFIRLKASWCKGGKQRTIPIRTHYQRQLLDEARALVKGGSLIPAEKKFIEQRRRYDYLTGRVGLNKLHGLRHQYAQDRYLELTGWSCPHDGGPSLGKLTEAQKHIDHDARSVITEELGHERVSIVSVYLGR